MKSHLPKQNVEVKYTRKCNCSVIFERILTDENLYQNIERITNDLNHILNIILSKNIF